MKELTLAERRHHRGLSDRLSTANLRNNPHHSWTVLKKACGWKVCEVIPPLVQNNLLHLDEKDKAEYLNSFFAQQCSAPSKVCDQQLPVHVGEQFHFQRNICGSCSERASLIERLESFWPGSNFGPFAERMCA